MVPNGSYILGEIFNVDIQDERKVELLKENSMLQAKKNKSLYNLMRLLH